MRVLSTAQSAQRHHSQAAHYCRLCGLQRLQQGRQDHGLRRQRAANDQLRRAEHEQDRRNSALNIIQFWLPYLFIRLLKHSRPHNIAHF